MAYGAPIPLLDWRPDDVRGRAGVLVDVEGYVPTTAGMRAMRSLVVFPTQGLDGPVTGAYMAVFPSGEEVLFVGTQAHLYKYDPTAFGGDGGFVEWDGGQTFGGTGRWRFNLYSNVGFHINVVFAVNGSDPTGQVTDAATPFMPISPGFTNPSSPIPPNFRPSIVEVVDQGVFFIAANTNQWLFTLNPRFLKPDVATNTVSDFLIATPGAITACHRIRGGVVMYKDDSFYMGQFTSPPFLWLFGSVSENIGVGQQEAVVNTGDLHLWPGPDNFYQFDGGSLGEIPNSLKQYFMAAQTDASLDIMIGEYVRELGIARWFYAPDATVLTAQTGILMYSLQTGKWLKGVSQTTDGSLVSVGAAIPAFTRNDSLTYTELGALVNAYNDFPNVTYDDPFFGAVTDDVPAVFSGGNLYTEDGPFMAGYFLLGELGDGLGYTQLSRARLMCQKIEAAVTGTMQDFTRRIVGALPTVPAPTEPGPAVQKGPIVGMTSDGAFNTIQTGRTHQLRFDTQGGEVEVSAIVTDTMSVGLE